MNMNYNETLRDPCPNCGKVGHIHVLKERRAVDVREQSFTVDVESFKCDACGCEFEAVGAPDALALAYRQYRVANGLTQPEVLKNWRQSLGLKQAELATLLGWSTATVSRYENGALQDDAHDRAMRAAMTPTGFAELVRSAIGLLPETLEALRKKADEQLGSSAQLTSVICHRISNAASHALDWRKMCETVLFFSQGRGVYRTKLNKLLFYADFLHIKRFERSLTGLAYVRLPHGPVPDDYELLFSALHAEGVLDISETLVGEHIAYIHLAKRSPDIGLFDTAELQTLMKVRTEFEKTSAKEISDRSHTEDAWLKTPAGQHVSLVHAKTLSLSL